MSRAVGSVAITVKDPGRRGFCRPGLAIAMRYGESRSLVIPRHRADPPPGRRAYELRRDDAGTLDRFTVHRAALRIGAEAVGDVSEDLRRRSNLDLFERRQSARAERFLAGGDEIVDARDLGEL